MELIIIRLAAGFFLLLSCFRTDVALAAGWTPVPIPGLIQKCFQEEKPVPYSFCLNIVPGSKNRDLIYHFHGRNGDATWWNDQSYYTGKVQAYWATHHEDPPMVASISFGRIWLLTERPDQPNGGLYSTFLKDVLPRVEREVGFPILKRMIVGESMGGVNALMVGLKSPSPFVKVAALCPPLATVSPFGSFLEIVNYIRNSSTSFKRAVMLYFLSRQVYPDEAIWKINDPVEVSKTRTPPHSRFYITCGAKDEWGCMKGNLEVVTRLQANRVDVHWVPRPGGHCDIDSDSLAEFLVK